MLGLVLWALAAASTPDFCVVSTEENASSLAVLTPDGELLTRIEVGSRPHEVDVNPNGRTAYVSQFGITDYDSRIGTPGDHVSRVDLATAREVSRYVLPDGLRAPHGVKLRPGAGELFVNAEAGADTMLVYQEDSGKLLRRFSLVKGSHNFIFSKDGRFAYVFAGIEGVAKYDASSGELLARRVVSTPIRGLQLAADGAVVAAGKGEVFLLEPDTLAVRRRLAAPIAGQMIYLETLADGTIIAPSIADNGVAWYDKVGAARFIPTGKGALTVRLGPDGRLYVSNVNDDHLTVMSTDGKVLAQIGSNLIAPNALGFGVCPTVKASPTPERG